MATEVTIEQLKQARAAGAVVIDVREPDEFADGHVTGAQSLPLSQLPARAQEVSKDETVYLVCQSGGRSGQAADLLTAAGHDVCSVAGGTTAWIESGGDIESGRG